MDYWQTAILALAAWPALAGEPVLTCEPRELRGVPGEPLRAELSVETDRAIPIQLRIPAVSNLVLYTVEKIPIQRIDNGRFVQKRIIIWQGIEAGSTTITNMTVVFPGSEYAEEKGPSIGITIDPVEPALPPAKEGPK